MAVDGVCEGTARVLAMFVVMDRGRPGTDRRPSGEEPPGTPVPGERGGGGGGRFSYCWLISSTD